MEFSILGTLEVHAGGRPLAIKGARPRSLLAILLIHANEAVPAERLVDLLWGEDAPETAAKALHVYVSRLRKVLELQDVLTTCPSGYSLRVDPARFDRDRFEAMARDGRAALERREHEAASRLLAGALRLWRGPALLEFALEGFAQVEINRLEELRATALEDRIDAELALGRHASLNCELSALVAEYPLRERLREQQMLALYRTGRQGDALHAFHEARRELGEELGVDPGPALRKLHEQMLRQDPSLQAPTPVPTNLTQQLTSFVGRERELAEVGRLLGRARLVTLTGAGGCGKTRLALEAANGRVGERPDGVWFTGLADLHDGRLVARAVLSSLGLSEEVGRAPAETLHKFLRDRDALLVLDNCEHLVDACAALTDELLCGCPKLRILATSREPLGVAGEVPWEVPPLSFPPTCDASLVRPLNGYEAVRLFAERAEAALPGFRLTLEDESVAAHICRRLDGLPLAIELAAARVRTLKLGEICERLDDRFRLLSKGLRTVPPRHKTLRAAMDWSYQLLDTQERTLLARLTVFSGGFTLEAAEVVCAGEGIPAEEVCDLLSRLVEKSLVVLEAGGRYRLLETVHEYGRARLNESDQMHEASRRHAHHYLRLARATEPHLQGRGLPGALEILDAERDNFRSALTWLIEDERHEEELQFATALWRFWYLRSHYGEGREWLAKGLEHASAVTQGVRAKALFAAGALAFFECDYTQAHKLCRAALGAFEASGDRRGMAETLTRLGAIARERGEYDEALATNRKAMELWQELGDEWGRAHSLQMSGFAAWLKGDLRRALKLSSSSLALFRELGDDERAAWALIDLGAVALYQGEPTRAGALLDQSLALFESVGFKEGIAWALNLLGVIARRRGDYPSAQTRLGRSLALHLALRDRWRAASVLEAAASLARDVGAVDDAARLLGAAAHLRETISAPVPPVERPDYQRTRSTVEDGLGVHRFEQCWAEGRAMSAEEAVALVVREAPRRTVDASRGAKLLV